MWQRMLKRAALGLVLYTAAAVLFAALGAPAVGAVQAASSYPETGWVTLVFYVGTLALILTILVLLIRAAKGEEVEETAARLMSIFLIILIASFSLAGGVQWLGRVSGIDGFVYQRADSFLDAQLQETINTYERVILLYETIKIVSALEVDILVVKVKFGQLLEPISKLVDALVDSVFVFVAAISMHKVFLVFGHEYAMSTLFPLGVVLWVFPWTRRAGSLLIAIAIALWFVFPFSVILILEQTSKLVTQDESPFLSLPTSPDVLAGIEGLKASQGSVVDKAKALAKIALGGVIVESALNSFVNAVFNWWAQMFVTWLLVPMINIIFLITMITNLTDAIGGEARPFVRMAKFLFPR